MSGVLNCHERAPFVKSMSVIFVTEDDSQRDSFNATNPQRMVLLPGVIQVPNINGMDSYQVLSKAYRGDSIPLRLSTSKDVINVIESTSAASQGAANGISPIGTFTLSNMTAFYNHQNIRQVFDGISEILLVFQYDSLSNGQNLDWIENCR